MRMCKQKYTSACSWQNLQELLSLSLLKLCALGNNLIRKLVLCHFYALKGNLLNMLYIKNAEEFLKDQQAK